MENLGWNSSYSFTGNIELDNDFLGNESGLNTPMIPVLALPATGHDFDNSIQMQRPILESEFQYLSAVAATNMVPEGMTINPIHANLVGSTRHNVEVLTGLQRMITADESPFLALLIANHMVPEGTVIDPSNGTLRRSDTLIDGRYGFPIADSRFGPQEIASDFMVDDSERRMEPLFVEVGVPGNTGNYLSMYHSYSHAIPSQQPENVAGENSQNMSRKRPRESEMGAELIRSTVQVMSVDGGVEETVGFPVRVFHQASNTNRVTLDLLPSIETGNHGNRHSLSAVFLFANNLVDEVIPDSAIEEQYVAFFNAQLQDPNTDHDGQSVALRALQALTMIREAEEEMDFSDKVFLLTYFLEASRGLFVTFTRQLEAFLVLSEVEQQLILNAHHEGGFWSGFVDNADTFCYLPSSIREWFHRHMYAVSASELSNELGHVQRELRGPVVQAPHARRRRTPRTRAAQVPFVEDAFENGPLEIFNIDPDSMSYEDMLALQERIGVVQTGLSEEAIVSCVDQRMFQPSRQDDGIRCIVCQDDLTVGDHIGNLPCGHSCYHFDCVKQWLLEKNICPICKAPVVAP